MILTKEEIFDKYKPITSRDDMYKLMQEYADQFTKPQQPTQEISDEELEKMAEKYAKDEYGYKEDELVETITHNAILKCASSDFINGYNANPSHHVREEK